MDSYEVPHSPEALSKNSADSKASTAVSCLPIGSLFPIHFLLNDPSHSAMSATPSMLSRGKSFGWPVQSFYQQADLHVPRERDCKDGKGNSNK